MENFILSLNVVLPMFLIMLAGYVLRIIGIWEDKTIKTMNNVCFRVFLPVLLFLDVYERDMTSQFNVKLAAYAAVCVVLIYLICFLVIPFLEKENKRRGVLIQGIFRSNYLIFGMPVTIALFGDKGAGDAAIIAAIVIPIFNVLSVAVLEIFRGGSINFKKILLGIMKNPLILGVFCGFVFAILKIKIPSSVLKAVDDIGNIATPMALLVLGGSFKFDSIKEHKKQLFIGLIGRFAVVPLIFLPLSVTLGFRGVSLAVLIALFTSPTAVSSFTMAQQMEADSSLAANLVIFGSAICIFTIFIWVFAFKQMGFL